MNPKISIIILNWNGWEDTVECLESLYQIDYPDYDVIIVDNDSKDNSIDKIKDYCEGRLKVESSFFEYNSKNKPITILESTKAGKAKLSEFFKLSSNRKLVLIENDENYGFAKGNNIGMKYALTNLDPDYILLLNNDTVVHKQFLKELAWCGDNNSKIAAIQSAIYYYNDKDRIQSLGGKLNIFTGIEYNLKESSVECDRLIGAAMLIRVSALKKIGFIDERYFLYMEETDWCYTARKNGFKLGGCGKSKVWHKIYSSSGGKSSPILNYYWTRNMVLFYIKNCKLYLPVFMIVFGINKTRQILSLTVKNDFNNVKAILYGLVDGILNRKGVMKRNY